MLTCCSFQNVRTMSPAPTNRTSASASSLTTMARRSQCAPAVAVVRPVALLREVWVISGELRQRRQTKEDAGQQACGEGEQEYSPVHGDLGSARDTPLVEGENQLEGGPRDAQTRDGSESGQAQAFDQALPREVPDSGADGFSNGHFVVARFGTGEQEISNVYASDQQNKADSREHHEHGRLNVADNVVMVGIGHQCVEFRIEGMGVRTLVRFLRRHDALEFLARAQCEHQV